MVDTVRIVLREGVIIQSILEPQRQKTYRMPRAPSEDSGQPAHPCLLINVFVVRMKKPLAILKMHPVKILIRLRGRAVWSESSLGAHTRKEVSCRYGSLSPGWSSYGQRRQRILARHLIKDGGIKLICNHNRLFVFLLLSRDLFNIDHGLAKSDSVLY